MSARPIAFYLCASAAAAPFATAEAPSSAIVQLRLPQHSASVDTIIRKTADGILVSGSALTELGINAPTGEEIPLKSVPGLHYAEDERQSAIILSCDSACFTRQALSFREQDTITPDTADSGAYLNYDVQTQWDDESNISAAAAAHTAFFSEAGLIESTWFTNLNSEEQRLGRLETRWTYDMPERQLRIRLGDSVTNAALGDPIPFAGIQIGKRFALTPSLITYPTPALEGDAALRSTAQLYVDGVLQGSRQIESGPFSIDDTPFVSGAGTAQLIVTDVLGRQQIISRPFFIDASLLRPGLTDWNVALGARRLSYESDSYGDPIAIAEMRRGLTNWLTMSAKVESIERQTSGAIGATLAAWPLGQFSITRKLGPNGASAFQWSRSSSKFSAALEYREADHSIGAIDAPTDLEIKSTISASASVDLDRLGSISVTTAQLREQNAIRANAYTFAYTPRAFAEAITFSYSIAERDRQHE
ncbi:MAG: fimbria/pilus outer membrane usher protein, partial [Caulobacterales bacterium]